MLFGWEQKVQMIGGKCDKLGGGKGYKGKWTTTGTEQGNRDQRKFTSDGRGKERGCLTSKVALHITSQVRGRVGGKSRNQELELKVN